MDPVAQTLTRRSNNRGGGKGPHSARRCEMTEWRHGASKSPSFFSAFSLPCHRGAGFPLPRNKATRCGCRALLGACSGQQCRQSKEGKGTNRYGTFTYIDRQQHVFDSYSFTFIQMKLEMNMKNIVHSTPSRTRLVYLYLHDKPPLRAIEEKGSNKPKKNKKKNLLSSSLLFPFPSLLHAPCHSPIDTNMYELSSFR